MVSFDPSFELLDNIMSLLSVNSSSISNHELPVAPKLNSIISFPVPVVELTITNGLELGAPDVLGSGSVAAVVVSVVVVLPVVVVIVEVVTVVMLLAVVVVTAVPAVIVISSENCSGFSPSEHIGTIPILMVTPSPELVGNASIKA